MKRIIAFIKPNMLNDTIYALHEIEGFPGAAVSEVKGVGQGIAEHVRQASHESFHGMPVSSRLEIICQDARVTEITDVIRNSAHTGLAGDGKIYVSPVEDAIRIRTGEQGEEAV